MKISLLALSVIFSILIVSSCSKKSESKNGYDFLINNKEIETFEHDYSEEDLELYKNDPDKVFYVKTNKQVYFEANELASFKDIKWFLNGKLWKNAEGNVNSFKHTFRVPGLYKIKLSVAGEEDILKFVRAIDDGSGSGVHQEHTASEETIPASVKNGVYFNTDIDSPKKWEAVLFTDVSDIGEPIKRRIWDFGDGTVIPSSGESVKYSFSKAGKYNVKLCVNLSEKCFKKVVIVKEEDAMADLKVKKMPTTSNKPAKTKLTKKSESISNSMVDNSSRETKESNDAQSGSVATVSESEKIEKQPLKEAVALKHVKITGPTSIRVGAPVRFVDHSTPAEAIQFRSWYINGELQNFHQKSVDMIFDEPGEYTVKMCLNYMSKYCKEIHVLARGTEQMQQESVASKKGKTKGTFGTSVGPLNLPSDKLSPTPEFEPIQPVSEDQQYFCQSYERAGLKSNYKCSTYKDYFNGVTVMTLKPNVNMELHNAKIFGNEIGFIDIVLSDSEEEIVGVLKKVQVLPGQTVLEFTELAMTLEAGKTYELTISTLPQTSKMRKKVGLLNASSCTVPFYDNENLKIDYQDEVQVIYDIKYCF